MQEAVVAALLPDETDRKTINSALWKSAQDGLLKKLEQGLK